MATNSAGIKITQAGISVPYAADYQYVFNSDWPSLAIAFDENIFVGAGSKGQIAHNLGFYPLTMAWFSVGGISVGRYYGITKFDKNNVYIDNSANSSDVTVNVKCYNLDITIEKDYALPQFPTFKTPYDPSTGIKVSKYNKSINSTDLRDFILHSRAQSPAVLSVNSINKPYPNDPVFQGTHIQYTNPAGYTPWVLGYAALTSDTSIYQLYAPGGNQSFPAFIQIGATSYILPASIYPTGLTPGSLVVLRDPLVVSNTKEVTYNG